MLLWNLILFSSFPSGVSLFYSSQLWRAINPKSCQLFILLRWERFESFPWECRRISHPHKVQNETTRMAVACRVRIGKMLRPKLRVDTAFLDETHMIIWSSIMHASSNMAWRFPCPLRQRHPSWTQDSTVGFLIPQFSYRCLVCGLDSIRMNEKWARPTRRDATGWSGVLCDCLWWWNRPT